MKKIVLFFLIMLFFSSVAKASFEDELNSVAIDESATENISVFTEEFSFYDTAEKITKGVYSADLKGVLSKTLDVFFSEIKNNIKLLSAVIMLSVICSFLSNLEGSFGKSGISEVSFLCTYAVLAGLTVAGFSDIALSVKNTISDMGIFTKTLIPTLTSMAIAEGKVVSAPLMHTQILASSAICSYIIEKLVIPLVYSSFAVKFINNMTQDGSLNNFALFLDKICKRIMSFMLLIFTALLTLTGFAAGTAENMGLKTARFALSAFVPVAGGALADTVSSLAYSAGMIKNSAGIAGITAIILMCAYPVIKCASMSFLYNLAGAVVEPVADARFSRAIMAVGECMGMLFAVVSVCASLYIISTAILLSAFKI